MKYYLIVFGCQMNEADGQKISAILENSKYTKTSKLEQADLVIITMCSVRQSAVDRVFGLAEKLKKLKNKPASILTGCILKKDKKTFSKLFDYVANISELVNSKSTSQGNKFLSEVVSFQRISGHKMPDEAFLSADIKALAENSLPSAKRRAYIPISNGCNNFCTYCVVPYTRGRLVCIDHKKILNEVKKAVENGAHEIWLLGQNVNDYTSPSDKSINFPELLKLVNDLSGNFKIFFMSPNPKNFSDKLIKVMANSEKFSRYLNLPIQSGDDNILKKMNRPYTAKKYLQLVKKIRTVMPDINLSTDVIVGFPEETKTQFNNTVKLFKKVKFNIAYINKYSVRWGTAASKLKDDVPWTEKKRREKILMDLL
jgi:tRNA-2-methylthio-N6-dimethylallyladenosine synthase